MSEPTDKPHRMDALRRIADEIHEQDVEWKRVEIHACDLSCGAVAFCESPNGVDLFDVADGSKAVSHVSLDFGQAAALLRFLREERAE